jgi:hypothetical protein
MGMMTRLAAPATGVPPTFTASLDVRTEAFEAAVRMQLAVPTSAAPVPRAKTLPATAARNERETTMVIVQTDYQYNAEEWWDAANALANSMRDPTFTRVFNLITLADEVKVEESDFESFLSAARKLEGWSDGPAKAPNPILFSYEEN